MSRRGLLQSVLASTGARCLTPAFLPFERMGAPGVFDDPSQHVRADHGSLKSPDFAALAPAMKVSGGIRPHRKGGVRLEHDADFERAHPGRFLIHNYGHSGAGITLSWGCAGEVRDLVAKILSDWPRGRPRPAIAVLGGGVIGLTVADEVRRLRPRLALTLYRREDSVMRTTSFIAGGQFEPSAAWSEYRRPDQPTTPGEPEKPSIEVLDRYLARSQLKLQQLQNLPNNGRVRYGVAKRSNYTFDHDNSGFDDAVPCTLVPPYRRGLLPFAKLNNVVGREYATWLMNPRILLPRLMADITDGGVNIRQKLFTSLQDVTGLREAIIINCLGLGAGAVFQDPHVQPRGGHLVVLPNPAKLSYFFSGGVEGDNKSFNCYLFARQNDIVIGGSVYHGYNPAALNSPVDAKIREVILFNMRQIFDGKPENCVRPPPVIVAGQEVEEG